MGFINLNLLLSVKIDSLVKIVEDHFRQSFSQKVFLFFIEFQNFLRS